MPFSTRRTRRSRNFWSSHSRAARAKTGAQRPGARMRWRAVLLEPLATAHERGARPPCGAQVARRPSIADHGAFEEVPQSAGGAPQPVSARPDGEHIKSGVRAKTAPGLGGACSARSAIAAEDDVSWERGRPHGALDQALARAGASER